MILIQRTESVPSLTFHLVNFGVKVIAVTKSGLAHRLNMVVILGLIQDEVRNICQVDCLLDT